MCQQTAGLVARVLEEHGIATVTLSAMRDVAEAVLAPRAVFLPFPFGSPMGRPKDTAKQTAVLRAVLAALEEIQVPGTIIEARIPY